MRLHPRTSIVSEARVKIDRHIDDVCREYDLTDVELIGILLGHLDRTTKYMLRAERHPDDPDRGADAE